MSVVHLSDGDVCFRPKQSIAMDEVDCRGYFLEFNLSSFLATRFHPKVKAYARAPGYKNSISNVRALTAPD